MELSQEKQKQLSKRKKEQLKIDSAFGPEYADKARLEKLKSEEFIIRLIFEILDV